jgi:hypothetical protein
LPKAAFEQNLMVGQFLSFVAGNGCELAIIITDSDKIAIASSLALPQATSVV